MTCEPSLPLVPHSRLYLCPGLPLTRYPGSNPACDTSDSPSVVLEYLPHQSRRRPPQPTPQFPRQPSKRSSLMTNPDASTSRSSTPGSQRIQRLLRNPPSHETIRSETQLLVDCGHIEAIRGFAPEDQARFLEILDHVRTYHRGVPSLEDPNFCWPRPRFH